MNQQSKGTALVIALIIVSVVAGMAFGISRIVLSGISFATSQEDTTIAYSAAEAGIEDGLFRWNNYKDISYPKEATRDNNWVVRVDLTKNSNAWAKIENPTPPSEKDHNIYELRIWRFADFIGTESQGGEYSEFNHEDLFQTEGYRPKLTHWVTYEFDITQIAAVGGGDFNLYWNWAGTNNHEMRLKFKRAGNEIPKTYQDTSPGDCSPAETPQCEESDSGDHVYYVHNVMADAGVFPGQGYNILQITPTGTAFLGIKPSNQDKDIGDAFSHIESTGYYGSAKRHLISEIRRPTL